MCQGSQGRGSTRHCHFQYVYAEGKVEAAQELSGGEGSATSSATGWLPHHTSPGPCHQKHKKSYKTQPVFLGFLASDTQDPGFDS